MIMKQNRTLVLLALMLANLLFISLVEAKTDTTIDMDVSMPENQANLPCVIISPGRGYHKDLPLIKDMSSLAVQEGFVVIRFNWSFFTAKSQPSADGSAELADIEAAITMAKQIPSVDSTRIYLVGKSMGSIIAYHAFRSHLELRGCILLTPIIPEKGMGSAYYPGLAEEERQLAFILGDKDIYNCALPNLYDYLATVGKAIPTVVLSGAHSFEEAAEGSEEINRENNSMAIETSVYWLKRMDD